MLNGNAQERVNLQYVYSAVVCTRTCIRIVILYSSDTRQRACVVGYNNMLKEIGNLKTEIFEENFQIHELMENITVTEMS